MKDAEGRGSPSLPLTPTAPAAEGQGAVRRGDAVHARHDGDRVNLDVQGGGGKDDGGKERGKEEKQEKNKKNKKKRVFCRLFFGGKRKDKRGAPKANGEARRTGEGGGTARTGRAGRRPLVRCRGGLPSHAWGHGLLEPPPLEG